MTKSHGRIETRKIWTSTELVGYLEIPFVAQVFPYRASQNWKWPLESPASATT